MSAMLFVKTHVSSFEEWKKQYDALADARKDHGWESSTVYRDADDPSVVVVVSRVKDVLSARRFYASPELLDGMVRGSVRGAPELRFLVLEEERTY